MTFAPASLLELRAYLQPLTGLASGSLGIVGDAAHATRGVSYHLGEDQLTATAYSRQTARDRAGLSNAASALDIGNHPRLRILSSWLLARCRVNAPGTSDVRELIFSPDGSQVLRWDRERGYDSLPRTGEADDSHLWHTHISWYRDSETRDKVGLFRPFYQGGDDVKFIQATGLGKKLLRVAGGADIFGFDGVKVTDIENPLGADLQYVGPYAGGYVVIINTGRVYPDGLIRPTLLIAKDGTIIDAPAPVAPVEPASVGHVVTLQVDGDQVWTGELP
jgi:hypothetical protein